jgi:hypothetical protein
MNAVPIYDNVMGVDEVRCDMDENRFLSLMKTARMQSYRGGEADYWHGYQRGLRRGYMGQLFGTDAEHHAWMRLAEDGPDKTSRDRGRGYRDGLNACGVAEVGELAAGSTRGQQLGSTLPTRRHYTNRR